MIYEGAPVGAHRAMFRPGFVRFWDPAALVGALADVRDTSAVVMALDGELPSNADLLCGVARRPGCGILEPEIAGVIFDADRFRATLFVAPDFREAPGLEFLPSPPLSPAFVQTFAASMAGTDGDARAGLRSRSLLSVGPGRLRADLSAASRRGAALEELVGEVDCDRWRAEAGLSPAPVLPLLAEKRLIGAGVSTTIDTLRQREQVLGTPLTLFLPERSRVEIYRDGRLLSARSYNAGTRDIFTGDLPRGTYEITMRIVSDVGVREETRLFVKTAEVPPPDLPIWRVQAGLLIDEERRGVPRPGRMPVLLGSTRHRLTDALAIGGDVALSPRRQGIGATLLYLLPDAQARLDGFVTAGGVHGLGVRVQGGRDRLTYWGGVQRIRGGRRGGRPGPARDELFAPGSVSLRADLSLNYRTVSGPLLRLRATWREDVDGGHDYAIGPGLLWTVHSDRHRRVTVSADATVGRRDSIAVTRLSVSWGDDRIRLTGDVGATGPLRRRETGTGWRPEARARLVRTAWQAPGERLDLSAAVAASRESRSVAAGLDYRGRQGSADGLVERDSRSVTRYASNVVVGLLGDLDGVALGGPDGGDSAIVVAVGGPADARFRVLVDGQHRGEVAPGRRLSVPLAPYRSYEVRLVQVAGGFIDFETDSRSVTLFPGNVRTLTWSAGRVVAIFGRMTTPDGRPLALARFPELAVPERTDDDGYFQIEVRADEDRLMLVDRSGAVCIAPLPSLPTDADFMSVSTLTCTPERS